jgi:hypothetical protein
LRRGIQSKLNCDRPVDAYLRMLDIESSAKALQLRTAGDSEGRIADRAMRRGRIKE